MSNDVALAADDAAHSANLTVKDVAPETRRGLRVYARRHGVSNREALDMWFAAAEEKDQRISLVGPTIDDETAHQGQPAASQAQAVDVLGDARLLVETMRMLGESDPVVVKRLKVVLRAAAVQLRRVQLAQMAAPALPQREQPALSSESHAS